MNRIRRPSETATTRAASEKPSGKEEEMKKRNKPTILVDPGPGPWKTDVEPFIGKITNITQKIHSEFGKTSVRFSEPDKLPEYLLSAEIRWDGTHVIEIFVAESGNICVLVKYGHCFNVATASFENLWPDFIKPSLQDLWEQRSRKLNTYKLRLEELSD